MAYADDLLDVARSLAGLPLVPPSVPADRQGPSQAALRRAISTAYYAIFHLLISEATRNWEREELRPELARLFDHGRMRTASNELQTQMARQLPRAAKGTAEHALFDGLLLVASTFLDAQQARNQADYNTARTWTQSDALDQVAGVAEAFKCWRSVRQEPLAQAYLLSLLGKRV